MNYLIRMLKVFFIFGLLIFDDVKDRNVFNRFLYLWIFKKFNMIMNV